LHREPIPSSPSPRPFQRFLSPEQAAEFLGGLNARTVTRWAREGYLPAYPIGEGKRRLWRFLQSDLESWMLARRTVAA
jgi:excisionase family DNA binding protein